MDVGQRLVDLLITSGVKSAFGVPGGQTAPFYHAMAERSDEFRHVLVRDERSGSFAADAYARVHGTVGVCDATVGPGATNLVSGLVEARSSSIPVLAVIADIPLAWEHRRHLGSASQGYDQRGFLAACVKWYGRVSTPDSIDDVARYALQVATSNRPGPAVLEIPDDVFSSEVAVTGAGKAASAAYPRTRVGADPAAIDRAVQVLREARKPLLFVGGGAQISGAHDEVKALAEHLGIPVATTISGKGIIAETHPLAVGITGSFGVPVANDVLEEADCVLVVGAKLGQAATLGWDLPAVETPSIHLDLDAEEIGRNLPDSLALHADAKLGLAQLREALGDTPVGFDWDLDGIKARADEWWDGEIDYKRPTEGDAIKPQDVIRELAQHLGPDDTVVTDASLASGWVGSRWRTQEPGRRVLAPRGLAGLGWGLPAAIGCAFARSDLGQTGRTVCLAGDGGWGYSLSEIETLARFNMPVVSIVLNNSVLGWNKHVAMRRYPDAVVSQDFSDANYADAARALGAQAWRVADPADLGEAIAKAFAVSDAPTVIEVISSEFETPVLKSMSGAQVAPETGAY